MKVTKTKSVIAVDEKEYEIIKAFCQTLTEIYENDTFTCMDEILENISYGQIKFNNFEFKFE